jgi:hypothetical protein
MEMSAFGIRRPLTFHILMFSSKTACELKHFVAHFHSVLRKPYTELSIGASYQIFFHLATEFQRRRILRKQELSVVARFFN